MQQNGITRLYYSIGEVCERTGLEAHVLRYWETEFDELRPRKNQAGRRIYTESDVETVRRIQHLLREEKYTIEGAKRALAQKRDPSEEAAFRQELVELRAFLQRLLEREPEGEGKGGAGEGKREER